MASIPCNYEINVTHRAYKDYSGREYWKYYCTIELGDTTKEIAIKKFNELKTIFGDTYKLNLQYWNCFGTDIKEED